MAYKIILNAQIPYATQQPKWYFPIYAIDATGKRDTVYIGDDPNAQQGNAANATYNDVLFGEKWIIPQNPNVFNLTTYYWISPTDSAMKVDINNFNVSNYLYYTISLSNVTLPVTFKWDVNKLRSDSLPFPNQVPLPRGQIYITFPIGNYWVQDPNVNCNINIPIVVSDTIKSQCNCYAKDSLTLLDPFNNPNPQSFYLGFQVLPWTGNIPTNVIENHRENIFSITPNPFVNFIEISLNSKSSEFLKYNVIIFNGFGDEVIRTSFTNANLKISTNNLTNGLYFIKLFKENGELLSIKKVIKN